MPSELLKQKRKEFENSSSAKAWRKTWTEYWKHNLLVPPQVFDFLRVVKADLGTDTESPKEYTIYTRKAKGSEFANPSFKTDEKMFNAITTVIGNLKSSIIVPNQEIRFFPNTRELRIWGFHIYIKKDTDRYILCNYMFGEKDHPTRWDVDELVEALGGEYEPDQRKKYYDQISSKIRELNKDVEIGIGFKNFIVSEEGAFVINPFNIHEIN